MHTISSIQAVVGIAEVCDEVKELLLSKNLRYGNSVFEPVRIFSKQDAGEQILVRIDDKLSRIKQSGLQGADEDTLKDLIGYLILLKVFNNNADKNRQDEEGWSGETITGDDWHLSLTESPMIDENIDLYRNFDR